MKIVYSNKKVEQQCTSLKAATLLFGGDKKLALCLHSRINEIERAVFIKDLILLPPLRFHNLHGKLKHLFAIDVKTKKEKWRIVLRPLDKNEQVYNPCNIDEIASEVKIVEIKEVSEHYE